MTRRVTSQKETRLGHVQTPDRRRHGPRRDALRPGDPHTRDMPTPGMLWAFVLVATRIGGRSFGPGGLVMVAPCAGDFARLVTISVGH